MQPSACPSRRSRIRRSIPRASFRFDYAIGNEAGERVATGYTVHAVLDRATSRMMAIPPWMAALLPVVSGGAAERV